MECILSHNQVWWSISITCAKLEVLRQQQGWQNGDGKRGHEKKKKKDTLIKEMQCDSSNLVHIENPEEVRADYVVRPNTLLICYQGRQILPITANHPSHLQAHDKIKVFSTCFHFREIKKA